MRRLTIFSLLTAAAAGGLVLGLLSGPRGAALPLAVLAQTHLNQHIYLPMGLKAQAMADLPDVPNAPTAAATTAPNTPTSPPPTIPPTVPPTDPPPSPTATTGATVIPPTETPTSDPPTVTPTPTFKPTVAAGAIKGKLLIDGKPAFFGLGEEVGPGLVLRRCADERTCEVVARTGVADDAGNFAFQDPPALDGGRYYQVTWINENVADNPNSPYAGANLWMGAFYGAPIRSYEPGQTIDVGSIEIADIVLVSPTHGSGYGGLPWAFTWRAREKETGSYSWAICLHCCQNLEQRVGAYHTPKLGRNTSYLMAQHPPGTLIGIDYKYCWFVRSENPDGGVGESFHVRMLWWFNPF